MNRFFLDYESDPDFPVIWWPAEDGNIQEGEAAIVAMSVEQRERLPRMKIDRIGTPTFIRSMRDYPNWPFI